jgi:hypothetical protein
MRLPLDGGVYAPGCTACTVIKGTLALRQAV